METTPHHYDKTLFDALVSSLPPTICLSKVYTINEDQVSEEDRIPMIVPKQLADEVFAEISKHALQKHVSDSKESSHGDAQPGNDSFVMPPEKRLTYDPEQRAKAAPEPHVAKRHFSKPTLKA